MFKVGDRVKCVDNSGNTHIIQKNKIYTIKSYHKLIEQYSLKEIGYKWLGHRFIRANSAIIKERLGVK